MARLREHKPLLALLGTGPLASGGQSFTFAPIYKKGHVPPSPPDRYVVIRPPLEHQTDYYVDLAPRSMESRFLVWGETRSDKLPAGCGFDDVLEPIFREIARGLLGSSVPIEEPDAPGGRVLQLAIVGAYTPEPVDVTASVKGAQMGHQLDLLTVI